MAVSQGAGRNGEGSYHINIHFLKPSRLNPESKERLRLGNLKRREGILCADEEYTCWLPHKLAEFFGENFEDQIRAHKVQDRWTPLGLNRILNENLGADKNGRHIYVFDCLEWESEITEGIARARCVPFKPFWGHHVQVI